MKRIISLLKAILTTNMNLFNFKANKNTSETSKVVIPIIMSIMVMFSTAVFSGTLAYFLNKQGESYIMLSMLIAVFSISLYMEGIYKSQDILFVSNDNDLLLSLPIKSNLLLLSRVLKLLIFQFIFNLLFILPVFIVYIFFGHPDYHYYITSILYMIIMPIIPTILASINGYIIKWLTTKFKYKKIMQVIFSLISMLIIFLLFSKVKITNIIENASLINSKITKYYYPVKAYLILIERFDIITIIKLILYHIIPLFLFIYLGSFLYFKIVSDSSETGHTIKKEKIKKNKVYQKLPSLVKKELLNFIGTPMYSFNALLGLLAMIGLTIYISFNKYNIINAEISNLTKSDIIYYLPKLYCIIILFFSSTLTISASSLSLEGKSFNLTKSLPIDVNYLIKSKLLTSLIISIPIILISSLIFIISFSINIKDSLLIIAYGITFPTLISVLGLLINFRYPKLEYTNPSEVVKQSLSIILTEFIGIHLFVLATEYLFYNVLKIYKAMYIELFIFIIITIVLYKILIYYGNKKYHELNI